jgi:hypothetical protein
MDPESQPDDSPAAVCRCGFARDHYMVSAEPDYTFWAWILMTVGISASPERIRYRCRRCDQVLEETREPAVLKAHY